MLALHLTRLGAFQNFDYPVGILQAPLQIASSLHGLKIFCFNFRVFSAFPRNTMDTTLKCGNRGSSAGDLLPLGVFLGFFSSKFHGFRLNLLRGRPSSSHELCLAL